MPYKLTRTSPTSFASSRSVLFNGSNQYLSVGNTSNFNFLHNGLSNWTVEGWVNFNTLSGTDSRNWISDGSNTSTQLGMSIVFGSGISNGLRIYISRGASGGPASIVGYSTTANVFTNTNTWYHVAVTFNTSSKLLSAYINGTATAFNLISTYQNSVGFAYSNSNSAYVMAIGRGQFTTPFGYFDGYMSNIRITNSVLYTASFTAPTSPLTAIANTSLLTCNLPTIVDSSDNNFTITNNNSATVSSVVPFNVVGYGYKFKNNSGTATATGKSVQFNGSNQYLRIANNAAFNFGTGNFTVECWFYATANVSSNQCLITNYGGPATGWSIEIMNGLINVNLSGDVYDISGGSLAINTWYHAALSGAQGSIKLFLNGVQVGSTYTGAVSMDTSAAVTIGNIVNTAHMAGYISNVRVVKGTALYTASFTPPTAPLTAIANTSLLACNAATIVDGSSNNFTITNNNSVTVASTTPFTVSTAPSTVNFRKVFADAVSSIVTSGLVLNLDASNASSYPSSGTSWFDLSGNGNNGTLTNGPTFSSANGGSIVFDGTNDYVDLGNISQLKPTTQITVSAWVYRSTMNDSQSEVIVGCTQGSGYELYYTANKMTFYVYAGGSYRIPEMSTSAISGWMNFTATYDNRYAKLYYNGVLQNTVDSGATNNISYVANNILIGAEAAAGSAREPGFEWTGKIAQTLIYNTSLSASEVLQNYNATKAKFGL